MRQHGNLSFIRTYQAGHAIPSYQPETAYKILTRVLFNLDVATGTQSTTGSYTSVGRDDPNVQLQATPQDLTYCYTYAPDGCYDWQQDAIINGTAEICNWIFVDANSTKLFPEVIAKCRAEQSIGGQNETGPGNNSQQPPEFEGAASTIDVGTFTKLALIVIPAALALVS